jgi:uncharacterized membrane protein
MNRYQVRSRTGRDRTAIERVQADSLVWENGFLYLKRGDERIFSAPKESIVHVKVEGGPPADAQD